MHRYFLELSYRGTHYSGWQIQHNAISVQQKINEALGMLLANKKSMVETIGCGRTDTGVHALQFFAHFDADAEIVDLKTFVYQLNGILPFDITIKTVHPVSKDAHARFDAVSRSYKYYIHTSKNGFYSEFSGCYFKKFEIEKLNEASALLLEAEDFHSFCKSRAQSKTTICKIANAAWKTKNGLYIFEITADRFLRGMVRALVGTLIDVGSGKLSLRDFEAIIEARNRKKAGAAAPACGLYLTEIVYPFLKVENKFKFPFDF